MSVELCIVCDEPTGRAGIHEDSLFTEEGIGPHCEFCFEFAGTDAPPHPPTEE